MKNLAWLVLVVFGVASTQAINTNQHGLNYDWSPANYVRTMDVPPEVKPFAWALTNSHWRYNDSSYTWDYGSGAEVYRHYVDPSTGIDYGPYTHFIDRTYSGATDSGRTFGSPTAPRATWAYPINIQADGGPVIMIRGEGYSFNNASSLMQFGGDGTEDKPIFYVGVPDIGGNFNDTNDLPTVTKGGSSNNGIQGNWMFLENVYFGNHTSFQTRPSIKGAPCTNIVVRNCYFRGNAPSDTGPDSVLSAGAANGTTTWSGNMVFIHNHMSDYGDIQSLSEMDIVGVIAGEHVTNTWVGYNIIERLSGDSIRFGADQSDAVNASFAWAFENTFRTNKENHVDIKQARNVVVTRNDMYVNTASSSSSSGTSTTMHYGSVGVWIMNNRIHSLLDATDAAGLTSSGGSQATTVSYWIGNIFFDIPNEGMSPDRGFGYFFVANNTTARVRLPFFTDGNIDAYTNRNNIYFDASGTYFTSASSEERNLSLVTHELFWEPGGGNTPIVWDATYNTVALAISGTSDFDDSLNVDPLFVDSTGNDYRLQSTSPARNAGYNWGTEINTIFQAAFGSDVSVLYDMNGTLRGGDGFFDMGALEYAQATYSTGAARNGTKFSGGAILR